MRSLAPFLVVALTTLTAAASPAMAQTPDPHRIRLLAAGCANCHGTRGISQGAMPNLAGQQRDYLARTLREFKEDKRPGSIMNQLAKGYTDEEIDALAAYFSQIRPR